MSLRFRLALIYSLIAFLLVAAFGGITTVLLSRALDGQFVARLDERADTLAENFKNPVLGQSRPPSNAYYLLVNRGGRVTDASAGLEAFEKAQFGLPKSGQVKLNDVPVRIATRPWMSTNSQGKPIQVGLIWVGLPESELIATQQSAMRILFLGLIATPLVTLLVGWAVGRHELRGLGEAARVAERLDPSQSLSAIPLPARQDEVYRLLEAINRLLSRIDAQQAREKQLLGQIVHELGAPLTAMRAHLERAESRSRDPDVGRAALVADELTFITQDLMQLARGQLEVKLMWHYPPAATIRGRLDRLVPGTQFTGDWSGMVLCDPDRLVQALRNLLANARRAAGPGGTVELHLESADQTVFRVIDSGPGLPEGLGERIFDPFVSGAGSSGLGLSVARQIAELHGGRLTGGNRPDGGAEFVLSLPGVSLEEGDEAGGENPAETPAARTA